MSRDYKAEKQEYEKLNLSKKVDKETLTKIEHKLFLEGCKDPKLAQIYTELADLECADLSDLIELERRNGGF